MKFRPSLTIFICMVNATLAVYTAEAQCVRTKLKATGFRGQVVMPDKKPLVSASVKLLKGGNEERQIVFSTLTDDNGMFAAASVESGEYFIDISEKTLRVFDTIVTRIEISKTPRSGKRSFLLVELGISKLSSSDSCEGDIVVLRR